THSQIRLNRSYFHAIYASGGLPVGLPFSGQAEDAREFFDSGIFDGVLFAGGCDIDPARYGEEITGNGVEIVPERDSFELEFARLLRGTDIPVLGICRGIQSLNVAFGGTLFQDIPGHRQEEPGREMPFEASVVPDTFLCSLLGGKTVTHVNSFHHQAVKDVAPGFIASAYSADGYAEAIEPEKRTGRFMLGVQWHPELFYDVSEDSRVIFKAFVKAAGSK
ncbi:MAG: gamma-glutamyl-gamma-aminobutyrate hydrolase family protein, partial [Clostridia bacterium]|nr:gamma-glutamyl-gamma-aminobutyrate hydrolase family protein [Clostridia bacterium]